MATTYYGETDRTRGLLTYSTSQTETEFTLTARTQLQAKSYGYSGYRLNTKFAGTTVSTKLSHVPGIYASWTTAIDTGDYSKTYSRTHSAQSVVVKSEYYGEGTGDYYAGGKSGDTSVTITIPAKSSYTVSYNANGGSGAPASQTKWYGENLTLQSGTPTRTNYVFLGWSTSSTATSATYSAGGTYSANAGATLYAVWKLNAYTVSYNKGANGTGTNTSDTKIHGTALTLKGAIFTRTGYTQTGWSTSDGGSKAYNLSASYTTNAAVTLYPFWTINTWTVSYNLQGGSGSFAAQTKTYNVTLTLRTGSPTKANASAGSYTVSYNANGGSVSPASATAARTTAYTFSKWNTAANGSGTNYNPGGSYTANAGATLYAQYTGSTSTAAVTLPTPTRTGYTFAGWYTSASGGSKVGNAGASYTPTGTVTIYAHWTANTYTVSYSATGASNVPSSQTKTHDVTLTLSSVKPTKADYVFNGWDTSDSATTVRYAPGASFTTNANTILYGVFTLNYSEPRITNVTAVRCDSSGTSQDDGTYVKVSCSWNTFSTNYKATKIEILYKRTNASSWTTGYTNNNPNASSGTLSQIIGGGNINAEYTYNIQIKITDAVGNGTYTTFVSSAFFSIDQGTEGKSLGFGMAAVDTDIPSNGRADFGMDAHFRGEVYDQNGRNISALIHQPTNLKTNISTTGWYRIAEYNPADTYAAGYKPFSVKITLVSTQSGSLAGYHEVELIVVQTTFAFVNETSKGGSGQPIKKIRYNTKNSTTGYIDVYWDSAGVSGQVQADIIANLIPKDYPIGSQAFFVPVQFTSVSSAQSGEAVRAEYTFKSNYNVYDDLYYKSGESVTISPRLIIAGIVQNSAKEITFELVLPKKIDNISSISVTACSGAVYGINGVIDASSTTKNWMSGYTVTALKRVGNLIILDIQKSSAMSGATTNTPCMFYTNGISLTFS